MECGSVVLNVVGSLFWISGHGFYGQFTHKEEGGKQYFRNLHKEFISKCRLQIDVLLFLFFVVGFVRRRRGFQYRSGLPL